MDIVAKGIEEKTQMNDLRGLVCQYGQCYFMAKPMPTDDIIELIESRPNW
jgi:EAL domain-containing protein (putative c-di-GMP-specific phosphodiesterase class I)